MLPAVHIRFTPGQLTEVEVRYNEGCTRCEVFAQMLVHLHVAWPHWRWMAEMRVAVAKMVVHSGAVLLPRALGQEAFLDVSQCQTQALIPDFLLRPGPGAKGAQAAVAPTTAAAPGQVPATAAGAASWEAVQSAWQAAIAQYALIVEVKQPAALLVTRTGEPMDLVEEYNAGQANVCNALDQVFSYMVVTGGPQPQPLCLPASVACLPTYHGPCTHTLQGGRVRCVCLTLSFAMLDPHSPYSTCLPAPALRPAIRDCHLLRGRLAALVRGHGWEVDDDCAA